MTEGQVRASLAADGGYELTLDRPQTGNVLTAAMTEQMASALRETPADAKFILMRGIGQDFCAGRESPMPPAGATVTAENLRDRVAVPVLSFYANIRDIELPLIALVRGRAHGVGCAIAGLADIVIADETANFMIPEMDRDIPPLLVMTALADRLSRAVLARMVLSREALGPEEAKAAGLVAETCTSDDAQQVVQRYRKLLSRNSITTLKTAKRFLNTAPETGFAMRKDFAAAALSGAVSERFLTRR